MTPSEERAGMDNETMRKVVEALQHVLDFAKLGPLTKYEHDEMRHTLEATITLLTLPERTNCYECNAELIIICPACNPTPAQPVPSTDDEARIRAAHRHNQQMGPGDRYEQHDMIGSLLRLLDAARAELAEQKSAPLTQDERDLLLVAGENIATVLRARFPTPPQPEQKT